MQPIVSVIIPAFRAEATISRAVISIQNSGLSMDQIEILISSDDGHDYARVQSHYPNCKVLQSLHSKTGPGRARNRALAKAQGKFIAFLDADDSWVPNYLNDLLPIAGRDGIAFSRTRILEGGQLVLDLPVDHDQLTFAAMAETGSSFWPVLHRDRALTFGNFAAQDILHSAELLSQAGGTAALASTYILNVRDNSVTAEPGFCARVGMAYNAYIEKIRSGQSAVKSEHRSAVIALFEAKKEFNRSYEANGCGFSYYQFLKTTLKGQTVWADTDAPCSHIAQLPNGRQEIAAGSTITETPVAAHCYQGDRAS